MRKTTKVTLRISWKVQVLRQASHAFFKQRQLSWRVANTLNFGFLKQLQLSSSCGRISSWPELLPRQQEDSRHLPQNLNCAAFRNSLSVSQKALQKLQQLAKCPSYLYFRAELRSNNITRDQLKPASTQGAESTAAS